jgi:hypothetical protein
MLSLLLCKVKSGLVKAPAQPTDAMTGWEGRKTSHELPRGGADSRQEAYGADISHHHLLQIQVLRPQLVIACEEAGERLRQFTRRLKALPGGMR